MLSSEIPRFPTDLLVRVFPGVWKLLLRPPSWDGSLALPLLSLFLSFVLPPFKDNGLPFWVPDVLCQYSEVVLWNLLSVQMFCWWICGGESGLSILFLLHLRAAPCSLSLDWFFSSAYFLNFLCSWPVLAASDAVYYHPEVFFLIFVVHVTLWFSTSLSPLLAFPWSS